MGERWRCAMGEGGGDALRSMEEWRVLCMRETDRAKLWFRSGSVLYSTFLSDSATTSPSAPPSELPALDLPLSASFPASFFTALLHSKVDQEFR